MKELLLRYFLYLIRWQLSTPILAPVVAYFKHSPNMFGTAEDWIGATVANLIGGIIFYWIDRFIFTSKKLDVPIWDVVHTGTCNKCSAIGRVYRLIIHGEYNRMHAEPLWLCEKCSSEKYTQLIEDGKVKSP